MTTTPNPSSVTIGEIIHRATMQLDGIGLNPSLINEAIIELERSLEQNAATALLKVLHRHIAQLKSTKKARKPARSEQAAGSETDAKRQ